MNKVCGVLFHQVFHEVVKVFVQVLQQFSRDDTCVVVNEVQFGHMVLLVVFENETERAQDAHPFNHIVKLSQATLQNVRNIVVKMLVATLNPLLHYASRNLPVIVVEGQKLARILRNPNMDVGKRGVVF